MSPDPKLPGLQQRRLELTSIPFRYDNGGKDDSTVMALSGQGGGTGGGSKDRRVTFSQIVDEGLGTGGMPAYVSAVGTVTYIKSDNMSYPACPNPSPSNPQRKCSKKVVDNGGGSWCDFLPDHEYDRISERLPLLTSGLCSPGSAKSAMPRWASSGGISLL